MEKPVIRPYTPTSDEGMIWTVGYHIEQGLMLSRHPWLH